MKSNTSGRIYFEIAGFTIQINFFRPEMDYLFHMANNDIKRNYSGFIIKNAKKADFIIDFIEQRVTPLYFRDHGKMNFIYDHNMINSHRIVTFYGIGFTSFQLILRKILLILLSNCGFLLHASASFIDKNAYLFMGVSGAGKSTAIGMLKENYEPLADDSVIIKREYNHYYMYQTPFWEKNVWIKRNSSRYDIGKIFFLKKFNKTQATRIVNCEKISNLLIKQFWSEKRYGFQQMKFILDFISKTDQFYFLYFKKNRSALIRIIKGYERGG